jgi:hypothetical protein
LRRLTGGAGFRVGTIGRVGVELEYLVRDPARPGIGPASTACTPPLTNCRIRFPAVAG